jgi:hypothetical protein
MGKPARVGAFMGFGHQPDIPRNWCGFKYTPRYARLGQ